MWQLWGYAPADPDSFYRYFGFENSPPSPRTLMVPLKIARRVLGTT